MKPEVLLQNIKTQSKELLRSHPEEQKNSTGYVYDNIELHHVKAAIYMNKHDAMDICAYSLHDLILNYDQYKMIAELGPENMTITECFDENAIPAGAFNPIHLVKYFIQLK